MPPRSPHGASQSPARRGKDGVHSRDMAFQLARVALNCVYRACVYIDRRVAELSEEQQAVLEPPGIRRPELDGATGRLANSLDATRVSYPPGGAPPSGAVGAVAPAARNPTDSRSYQATRGGNEDG